MQRSFFRKLLTVGLSTSLAAALLAQGGLAEAKGSKKKAAATAKAKGKPKRGPITAEHKKALGELMGAFQFGMTKDDILKVLQTQLDERYAEKIADTQDVYQQDKLRKDKKTEIGRVKKSFVEFDGKKSGWDVSIIDDQFAQNTGESMLVHWENEGGRDQRRFFFFHDGKLYRMFISIAASQIPEDQRNFGYFKDLMTQRFGPGDESPAGVSWKTDAFEVDALDKVNFYDAFCLVIVDPKEQKVVAEARAANKTETKESGVLKAMVQDGDDKPDLDSNRSAVDKAIQGGK
jgi:hypothetical protein